jgi:phenylpropionate dioxygenase-like ring-hydroxylating dioxygenase large terminal subunit
VAGVGVSDVDRSLLVRPDGTIPKERYLAHDFLDVELDRMWSRIWQVAGREEEIPDPGDFLEYTIGDESVLVTRGRDCRLRAFYNSCLHKGTRLAEGCGQFDESADDGDIRCPYHAWRYALDGRLVEVVDAGEFPGLPEGLALTNVRVDTWGGFVWVCLDPDALPLLDFLNPLPTLLAPYHLDEYRFRAYLTTILPANWKVVIEAFAEGYHVQGTHPQTLPWVDDVGIEYEQFETHAHYGRIAGARRVLRGSPRLGLDDEAFDEGDILLGMVAGLGGAFLGDERAAVEELRAAGLPRGELLAAYQVRRMAMLASRGFDVSGLEPDQMTSADDVHWFPNLVGPIYPGSAILFRVRPNGTDPDSSIKDTWVLEWPAPDAEWEMPRRRRWDDWTERDWGEITNQDYANMARVQAGLKSRGCTGVRLATRQESNIAHLHRVIDRYLTS